MFSQNQNNMGNFPTELPSGGELSARCAPRYQCVLKLLLDSDEVYVHTQSLHTYATI